MVVMAASVTVVDYILAYFGKSRIVTSLRFTTLSPAILKLPTSIQARHALTTRTRELCRVGTKVRRKISTENVTQIGNIRVQIRRFRPLLRLRDF